MRQWSFVNRDPRHTQREPVQGEFFNTEDIETQARELVRESVQNSLDAHRGTEAVHVRVYVSESSGALEPDTIADDVRGLWQHALACPDPPPDLRDQPCSYVVIEDFGTTGLIGDATAQFPDSSPSAEPNHFYYFFRAEGSTGKAGGDRGRWGLGKFVFPKASGLSAFFGVTSQAEEPHGGGPRLLMGKSILKTHELDGDQWMPDGWFARLRDADDFQVPVDDPSEVAAFANRWSVSREDGQPGLSVVIPYADRDLTSEAFVQAIVAEYFVAVLQGRLTATVEWPTGSEVIDRKTLSALVDRLPRKEAAAVRSAMELVRWRIGLDDDDLIDVAHPGTGDWPDGVWEEEERTALLSTLRARQRMAFRVPVKIHHRGEDTEDSYVEVLLQADDDASGTATYARGGIIIPGVGGKRHRGVRAILLAEDGPVTRFLGDAENPAHTKWQERGEKFRDRYELGPKWLRFVRHLPGNIVQAIRTEANALDETILERWFSVSLGEQPPPPGGSKGTETPGPIDEPEVPPLTPRLGWGSSRHKDGTVVLAPRESGAASTVEVTIVYDAVDGGARKWDSLDFSFDPGSGAVSTLSADAAGADVLEAVENRCRVKVTEPEECRVEIRGLDPRRDVVVDVTEVTA